MIQRVLWLLGGWLLGWFSHELWIPEAAPPPVSAAVETAPPAPTAQPPAFSSPLTVFRQLLSAGHYRRAVQHYEAIQTSTGDAASQPLRKLLLEHVIALQQAGQHAKAITLLNAYLEFYYRDSAALLALAASYQAQRHYPDTIETLYEALSQAYQSDAIAAIKQRIRAVVALYTTQLRQQQNHQALLALYQKLTELEADYGPYFIELAQTQFTLGHDDNALVSLQTVLHDPVVGPQARRLLQQVEQRRAWTANGGIAVPLQRTGDHFLVTAKINDHAPLTLLLDTGASLSIIKSTTLQRLGFTQLDAAPARVLNTANGPVTAAIILLDSLTLGNQRVENVEVGGLDLPEMTDIDGLLGMNFLKNFRFFIDQEQGVLYLSPPAY